MHLPEELLDEIFSHLPSDDRQSLQDCSLVSKSWLQPSRRLLFVRVVVDSITYQSWLDNISPTNTGLLRHVRSLTYHSTGGDQATDSRYGVYALRDYLPSFFQLQQLILRLAVIKPTAYEHLEWFSAFQHTLSSLYLGRVSITWSAFVALVGYFPNLRDLSIFRTSFQVDDRPVPPLPHALRGKLSIISRGVMECPVDRLVGLKMEYEEFWMRGRYETRVIAAVERTLKHLKIGQFYPESTLSLSRCLELRQLEIGSGLPHEEERAFISSITSTNLRKLVFSRPQPNFMEDPCWTPFDDTICGLVDRLQASGYKYTLELELQADSVELGEEAHHKDFLPKFKEKGLVRIIDFASGRVWEWPRK
ncbi:hypothetical protein BDM02DRAFT_3117393 [Thelephora ganbajun]|uniref:Uncharacterized protein n=1 Tax=Thelephora ganbajun TaxID=370292 RepID=A0ACB6ZCG2_THEGA|nr:hypothetical protein BDM02DRAFT_3117393 [Thelephora ganbajun]